MKILVIDDAARNQHSAHELLASEHDVEVMGSIGEVFAAFSGGMTGKRDPNGRWWDEFDLVMVDLYLPAEGMSCIPKEAGPKPVDGIPAGLIIAIAAMNAGVKVLLVSEGNHHDSWLFSVMDLLYPTIRGRQDRAPFVFIDMDRCTYGGYFESGKGLVPVPEYWKLGKPKVKDWAKALRLSVPRRRPPR